MNCGSTQIGFNHGTRAVGYVTVDVVSYCSSQFPTDDNGGYFAGATAPILFDNVLLGDYQQLGPAPAGSGIAAAFDAEGNPMVHIRAMPEGQGLNVYFRQHAAETLEVPVESRGVLLDLDTPEDYEGLRQQGPRR